MARKPSIVLSPAEQKAAAKEAKANLKAAETVVKELVKQANVVAKARAAEDKTQLKLVAAAEKEVVKAQNALAALVAE